MVSTDSKSTSLNLLLEQEMETALAVRQRSSQTTVRILNAGLLVRLRIAINGSLLGLCLCYFQGLRFSLRLNVVSSDAAGYKKKQLTLRNDCL